jgi:GntR family transcriptional repressor for pyruvate dehydrogenase complex
LSAVTPNGLSASSTAMDLIREGIATGKFAPNSRSALREAIRALELVGVLRSKHGSGTFVTSLEAEELLRGLDYSKGLLSVESAVELAEFRRVIEPAACAMAAERATTEQKAQIRSLFEEMQLVDDPVEYARIDPLFHEAILRASGNSVLIAVSSAFTFGPAWLTMWRAVIRDVIPERTRREHEALVVAIETGDRDLASATAHAHIAGAQTWIARAVMSEADR